MKNEKGIIMTIIPLIAILIISTGIITYNKAQTTIQESTNQLKQVDVQAENSMIEKYIGENKKGTEVKQMINEIIAHNKQYVNEDGKFISIDADEIGDNEFADLSDACYEAEINNNQENVEKATEQMRKLYSKIVSNQNYEIEGFKDYNGIINEVSIYEK